MVCCIDRTWTLLLRFTFWGASSKSDYLVKATPSTVTYFARCNVSVLGPSSAWWETAAAGIFWSLGTCRRGRPSSMPQQSLSWTGRRRRGGFDLLILILIQMIITLSFYSLFLSRFFFYPSYLALASLKSKERLILLETISAFYLLPQLDFLKNLGRIWT